MKYILAVCGLPGCGAVFYVDRALANRPTCTIALCAKHDVAHKGDNIVGEVPRVCELCEDNVILDPTAPICGACCVAHYNDPVNPDNVFPKEHIPF